MRIPPVCSRPNISIVAGSSGAVARRLIGIVLETAVAPFVNDVVVTRSGSTLNLNEARSPGLQPAAMSPAGGAHTFSPDLSTTDDEKTRLHSRFVGKNA